MKAALERSVGIAEGIGAIKFAVTTLEVEAHFGSPDERELLEHAVGLAEMWYYSAEDLQLIFRDDESSPPEGPLRAMRLDQVTTGHPETSLWGSRIIGLPESSVLTLFRAHGYEVFTPCDESVGTLSYRSLRLDRIRVTLDFRGGVLQRILWGAIGKIRPGRVEKT